MVQDPKYGALDRTSSYCYWVGQDVSDLYSHMSVYEKSWMHVDAPLGWTQILIGT